MLKVGNTASMEVHVFIAETTSKGYVNVCDNIGLRGEGGQEGGERMGEEGKGGASF